MKTNIEKTVEFIKSHKFTVMAGLLFIVMGTEALSKSAFFLGVTILVFLIEKKRTSEEQMVDVFFVRYDDEGKEVIFDTMWSVDRDTANHRLPKPNDVLSKIDGDRWVVSRYIYSGQKPENQVYIELAKPLF